MGKVEVLKKAFALIKKGWTQGAFARKDGGIVSCHVDADSYCAAGAVYASCGVGNCLSVISELDRELEMSFGYPSGIIAFNDERTKEEVLEVYRKTIERLEIG